MQLNRDQVKKLSNISADIAQVFFASVALPYLDVFTIDGPPILLASLSILIAIGFWLVSLRFLNYIHAN